MISNQGEHKKIILYDIVKWVYQNGKITFYMYDSNMNRYRICAINGLIISDGKKFNRKYFIENLNK